MYFSRNTSLLALGLVIGLPLIATAQTPPKPAPPASPFSSGGGMAPHAPDATKAQAKDQEIDDVVKDFTKMPGIFTFYRQKKGANDQVYMEVPESMLEHWLLLQATASTGTENSIAGLFHGAPLSDIAFKLRIVDETRVQMYTPELENRAPDSPEARRALGREFGDTLLYGFEIKARQKSRGSILLDVTNLFKSDVADVSQQIHFGAFGYGMDPSGTYLDSVKVFPDNAVFRTIYKLNLIGMPGLGPRSTSLAVSYNLSALPEDGYKPRLGDTRVGYFTTSFRDHSDPTSVDPTVNYISRFRLEKADPNAAMSPPKKPIVFYIDNAMPKEFRPAATEGLLAWNKAFEEIGIKDAIVVKQMPDNADWDIADVRYNVVRWTVNIPFSIALFRVNPLTGEVLNACINFDSAFATDGYQIDPLTVSSPLEIAKADSLAFARRDSKSGVSTSTNQLSFSGLRDVTCDLPAADEDNRSLALEALEALDGLAQADLQKEKFRVAYESIRETACHEMGHCLGLRHNFIASTYLTNDQLASAAVTNREGISASVMDYNSINYAAIGAKNVDYYSGVVGKYDKWAIKYGYLPIKSDTPQGELYKLSEIASHTNEHGLEYESDAVADAYDPMVRRFDMSSDPIEWMRRTSALSARAIGSLEKRHPAPGESDYQYTKRYLRLFQFQTIVPVRFMATYIGGTLLNKSFRGDPGEKPSVVPVSRADQQRALSLIVKDALSEDSPAISPHAASLLASNPNLPENEGSAAARLFPVLDIMTAYRSSGIDSLFIPSRLMLVVNNEERSSDTLSLSSLFSQVKHALWTELENGHEISPVRRGLQRRHIEWLSLIYTHRAAAPADAESLANIELHELDGQLRVALAKRKDPMQKAHLQECIAEVRQALEARPILD